MEPAENSHLHVEFDRNESGRSTPKKEKPYSVESASSPRDRDERFEVYKYVLTIRFLKC